MALETIVHEPLVQADTVIIWLHGLGADAHDFASLVSDLGLTRVRFIFPNAPVRPVTVNNGMSMRSWYDFRTFEFSKGENVSQLEQSVVEIAQLVVSQINEGIKPSKIFIGGFSQGGAVALLVPAMNDFGGPLGGVIAWSTYLPQQPRVSWLNYPPTFMAHGKYDPVIPWGVGKSSGERLKEQVKSFRWREYPMEHQVCADEIADLRYWLIEQGCGV